MLIIESGHISIPIRTEQLSWSVKSVFYAETIVKKIVKKYGKEVRLVSTWLVNNMKENDSNEYINIKSELFGNAKFLTAKATHMILEKNMKNRAFKRLKELKTSYKIQNQRVYIPQIEYSNDLPVANINSHDIVIPRCGMIINSFLEQVARHARHRAYGWKGDIKLLLSMSNNEAETEQMKHGVNVYNNLNIDKINCIIFESDLTMANKSNHSLWIGSSNGWTSEVLRI